LRDIPSEGVNFQGQYDGPFWFQLSGGELAKRINSLVDLSLLDRLLQEVNADVRQAQAEHKVSRQQVDRVREQFERLRRVPEMRREWRQVTSLRDRLEGVKRERVSISTALSQVSHVREEVRRSRRVVELGELLDSRLADDLLEVEGVRERLMEVVERMHRASSRVRSLRRVIQEGDALLREAGEAAERLEEVAEEWGRLQRVVGGIQRAKDRMEECLEKLKEARRKIEEFGDKCPLCGGPISEGRGG